MKLLKYFLDKEEFDDEVFSVYLVFGLKF